MKVDIKCNGRTQKLGVRRVCIRWKEKRDGQKSLSFIVNGEMDVYEIFATYASVIGHVHLKDINEDRSWAPMGEGIIDFPRLLKTLHDAGYDGWIDIEEESADARVDPDAATLKNGRYLAETLLPLGF